MSDNCDTVNKPESVEDVSLSLSELLSELVVEFLFEEYTFGWYFAEKFGIVIESDLVSSVLAASTSIGEECLICFRGEHKTFSTFIAMLSGLKLLFK